MTRILSAIAFTGIITLSAPALAMDGDAAAGEKVFKKCKACHLVDEAKNKVGPHLVNLFGRQPGSIEDYKYSSKMVEFGEGKVWDAELVGEYLAAPKKVVKGTKMAFAGLKKDEDVANVIAYLMQFSEENGEAAEGESETTEETESTN